MFRLSNRRYTGSKSKLKDWIKETVLEHNGVGKSFCDLFAGTGIIAEEMLEHYDEIIINDFLISNETIYHAFFSTEKYDSNKIHKYISEFKKIDPDEVSDNYVSDNFGDKYFAYKDAKLIGEIRERIERAKTNLNKKEYSILLASLIYSFDRSANTVGHYDAYFKRKGIKRSFKLEQIKPIYVADEKTIKIFREDSNELVRKIKADIVYIDPPYSSRQYSRFYHVIENIVKWEKPELFGVALKPKPIDSENSEYCKVNAPLIFADLIENIDAKTILVSYNNTYNSKSNSSKNKMTFDQIKDVLSRKGVTKVYSKKHRAFNTGKTDFDNHKEYLFITKVGEQND
jgi:adenine-specific DNA-methyltransferase